MPPESTPPRGAQSRILSEAALLQDCGRLLVSRQQLTRTQLDDASSRALLLGRGLDQTLLEERLISEDVLLACLAEISGVPLVAMAQYDITAAVVGQMPAATALHYRIVPVAAKKDTLTIATSRVYDRAEQESLQTLLQTRVEWVLCRRHEVDETIKHFYGIGADIIKDMPATAKPGTPGTADAIEGGTPGIARLVQTIIRDAIQMNASDIHLDPMDGKLKLRYRVDGVLLNTPLPDGTIKYYRGIVSSLKVMAQLNITERRLPQDGRICTAVDGESFDIRVSVLPSQFGESVNLRILNRKTTFLDLQEIGLLPHQLPMMKDLMTRPYGIVLITGPTGSGKTSTLYATLAKIDTESLSVVTIEDPVEYQVEGILQIQTDSDIGLNFAAGLRSVLRHDPNVILIGEIRDSETADIAIKSSLTGHLVFSTLHTNDSASAIARLVDMGVEPFLVASSIQGIIAQRLVRRVCPRCQESTTVPDAVRQELSQVLPEPGTVPAFVRGRGCPDCTFTGYKGRFGVFEILMVDSAIRPLIVQGVDSDEIARMAVKRGMETLRRNAWVAALKGLTTAEEVMRVTQVPRSVH
jgi:type II secretory ATPase GspE/PulE/Tfp pilus assembly ATPase PilB-like protein